MAIKIPGPSVTRTRSTPSARPAATARVARRHQIGRRPIGQVGQVEEQQEEAHDPVTLLQGLARRVRRLNSIASADWEPEQYEELEQAAEDILGSTEKDAQAQHGSDVYAKELALSIKKRQLRMLLQTLQPPEELVESFRALWEKLRGPEPHDVNTFINKTLMNNKVRQDVMNRQMEEAINEADDIATHRRVEAISRDDERRRQRPNEDNGEEGGGPTSQGASKEGSERTAPAVAAVADSDLAKQTLRQTLRILKKKRREIGKHEVEEVAAIAFETMRALRDEVAPRWAPDAQPWLLNTADNHIFQSILGVIPEELFRETNAYDGMQSLRAGEHAFGLRAADSLMEGLRRSSTDATATLSGESAPTKVAASGATPIKSP